MKSDLGASGFTKTNTKLHKWAGKVVSLARELFKEEQITAGVWAYREQGGMMLSCDLYSHDKDISLPITINTDGEYWLPEEIRGRAVECEVQDMVEAVHLAGIITQALNAKVKVGLGVNEVNPDVLKKPLSKGQTNGPIDLWK